VGTVAEVGEQVLHGLLLARDAAVGADDHVDGVPGLAGEALSRSVCASFESDPGAE
jgi:hypothetical protein